MRKLLALFLIIVTISGCASQSRRRISLPKRKGWDGTYKIVPTLRTPPSGELFIIIYPDGNIESVK